MEDLVNRYKERLDHKSIDEFNRMVFRVFNEHLLNEGRFPDNDIAREFGYRGCNLITLNFSKPVVKVMLVNLNKLIEQVELKKIYEETKDYIMNLRSVIKSPLDMIALERSLTHMKSVIDGKKAERSKLYPVIYVYIKYLLKSSKIPETPDLRNIIMVDSCKNRLNPGKVTRALPDEPESYVITSYTPFVMGSPVVDDITYDTATDGYILRLRETYKKSVEVDYKLEIV